MLSVHNAAPYHHLLEPLCIAESSFWMMHIDHVEWAHPLSAPSLSLSLMSVPPPTVPPLIPVITFPPTLLFPSQSSPLSSCLSWICGASVLWSPPLLPPPYLLFPPVLLPCLLSASHVPDPSPPRLRVIDWVMCSSSCDGSSKNPFNPITSPHNILWGQHHQIYQWEITRMQMGSNAGRFEITWHDLLQWLLERMVCIH